MFGLVLALAGCTGSGEETGTDPSCEPVGEVGGYAVAFETAPAQPVAGQEAEFTIRVRDDRGCPIEDLQAAHERVVHTLLISRDLSSFQHLHHEDFAALTADDVRNSTFRFPVTFPAAGDYRLVFDYAHRNEYLVSDGWLTVGGAPAQATVPTLDYTTERTVGDLRVALRWDVEPYAGYEASWAVTITTLDGEDITDLVQWLGADGHAAVASADLAWVNHTHAWFPGMEDVAPGHDMPSVYHGPELPFHFTFPAAGAYTTWIQFAREGAPDEPYVAQFAFDVAP